MTERDFLRAIDEEPDEPDTYLVYADWLEEHGEDARARLIRLEAKREWSRLDGEEARENWEAINRTKTQAERSWPDLKKWRKAFDVRWKLGVPRVIACGDMPTTRVMQKLPELFSLTTLSTCSTPTPEELAVLAERCGLHTISFTAMPDLDALGRLTELHGVSFYEVSVNDPYIIEHLGPLKKLRYLRFCEAPIHDDGAAHLASFPLMERLYLSSEDLTDAALDHLVGLRHLKELDLSGARITDAGLAKLAGLKNLTRLNVGNTGVTVASLDLLLKFKKLRWLGLGRVDGIDDNNVLRLAKLPELRFLDLARTGVTRYNLRRVTDFPRLKRVHLEGSMDAEKNEKWELRAFREDMKARDLLVDIDWE